MRKKNINNTYMRFFIHHLLYLCGIINANIIGYIHICQKGQWKRSITMLLKSIKDNGLYNHTDVIRIGIVNDDGIYIEDDILKDDKFDIVYLGKSEEYERPTLLHMRKKSEVDPEGTLYYYLHSKGIKRFDTVMELPVIDWIYLMLYWNIERWELAIEKLKTYNTYGCNYNGRHYSGNFWWAKKEHIMKLPTSIESYYIAPEDWVCTINDKIYSAFNSIYKNGHYTNVYPRELYVDAIPL